MNKHVAFTFATTEYILGKGRAIIGQLLLFADQADMRLWGEFAQCFGGPAASLPCTDNHIFRMHAHTFGQVTSKAGLPCRVCSIQAAACSKRSSAKRAPIS
ncbi:hypothetical protein D3C78_1671430 [compost metagenome]